ncbi:MAG: ABC transporter ATP-binding protein [Lachnospiraceae bacterium]|nr:ABC transporter ATP-binding protein [Lachnospiraceae bacterium]
MIEIKNGTKIYGDKDAKVTALNGINLKIEDGEMVAVMGASGSGKSTLLNILGGMDKLTEGEYIYGGEKVENTERFRKSKVSFVFQHFALMNDYSVLENVELPLEIAGVKKAKRREIALKSLEKVGLKGLEKKYPNKLSGGQRQRVAVARALAKGSELVLADEPTGALDQETGRAVIDLLREVNKEKKTVVIITHDENVAKKCDRVIRIADGKLE